MIKADDIADVKPLLYDRVWAILEALDEREAHFNEQQSRYRALASTWLLAAFAGIGFVFSEKVQAPVPRELIAILIAMGGAIGVALLWVVDVLVYHDLLIAGYAVGQQLEQAFPWLPPVRSNFSLLTRGPAVRWYIAGFYLAAIAVLVLLGAAISILSSRYWWLGVDLVVGLLMTSLIIYFTQRALRRKRELPHWLPKVSSSGGA